MPNYDFQDECLEILKREPVGKIILPTGSGKSRIAFEFAKSKLVRDNNENGDGHELVVFVAPRIILCQQLISNLCEYFLNRYNSPDVMEKIKCGYISENANLIEELITFVSCGTPPTDIIIGKVEFELERLLKDATIINTTKPTDIAKQIDLAVDNDRDSIIFSTYASFGKCVKGIKKSKASDGSKMYLIADEAHYFVRGKDDNAVLWNDENEKGYEVPFKALKNNLKLFPNRLFFTATPKVEGIQSGMGMDNEKIYGPTLYEKKPKDLIANGIICEPKLHIVHVPDEATEENINQYAGDLILQTFFKHEEEVNNACQDPNLKGKIGAKLLVAVDGSKQLGVLKSNGFLQKAKLKGITVAYTMSNKDIGRYFDGCRKEIINGNKNADKGVGIDEFLQSLKSWGSGDRNRLIVLHYDQLTEGIDVPSMTGLLVMRSMPKDKMVQNIGRVLRTHDLDRKRNNPVMKVKPYSFIIVPNIYAGETEAFKNLLDHLKEDYNAEISISKLDIAKGDEEEQLEQQSVKEEEKVYKTFNEDLIHEIEKIEVFRKSLAEQIEKGQVSLQIGHILDGAEEYKP